MDRVSVGPVKGLRIAVVAFVLSVSLFVVAVGGGIYILTSKTVTTQDFSQELRDGLVHSCEVNGDPLRAAVRGLLRQQIANAESPDVRKSFPDSFLDAIVAADEKQLQEIAPVNCQSLYPARP